MPGVGRGATKNGDFVIQERAQACFTGHGTAREAKVSQFMNGFQRGPKAEEWAEGKREKKTVGGRDARGIENDMPLADYRCPTLACIEPAKRGGAGAAGLMATGVGFKRMGQI